MSIDSNNAEVGAILTQIEEFLEGEQQNRHIPGLSVAIVYDKEILWARGSGYAQIDSEIPATPQTVYRVASITKLFTATMLMQLRDMGKLHLDDPIEQYLPEFKIPSRFADPSPLTFRQVATHLSGLPRRVPVENIYQEDTVILPSIEGMLANLEKTELVAAPMTRRLYSNLGYAILGHALERIVDQPYADYVAEHILYPLGMYHSGFEPNEQIQMHFATGYNPLMHNEATHTMAPRIVLAGERPAGDLYSSVEDMAHFISLQFHEDLAGGAAILKGSTLREMHLGLVVDPSSASAGGIGWGVSRIGDYTAIGHDGLIYGYSSDLLIVPALKLGLVMCMNTVTRAREISRASLEMLLPVFSRIQKPVVIDHPVPLPQVQPEWQRFVGRYAERGLSQTIEIRLTTTSLMAIIDKEELLLLPEDDLHFRMQDGSEAGEPVSFILNEEGVVAYLQLPGFRFVRE